MKTKSIFLAFATLLALLATSCSKKTYYQVYQTKAVDTAVCSQVGNYLVHEESDCVVRYNFYAEEGDAGFWLTNKTDSIIYVDLGETFFVLNGNASDYFQARQWTTTRSSTVSSSKRETKGRGNRASSESASQTSTKASTFSERRVIAVPPQSTRYFSEFHINGSKTELCGGKDSPRKGRAEGTSFTIDNSPYCFGNFISYTVGCKGKKRNITDNFFISEIINVNAASMYETVRSKDACGRECDRIERLRFNTPDRFYLIYKK